MSEQPQKSGMSGCAIAAIIFGVLVVLGIVAMAVGFFVFMRSDAGKVMGEAMNAAVNAQNKPGAAELRAAGCQDAMVLDFSGMMSAVEKLVPDAGTNEAATNEEMKHTVIVACTSPPPAMTCAMAAKVYAPFAPPQATSIQLTISEGGTSQAPRCEGWFDRSGNEKQPPAFDDKGTPPTPSPSR